MLDYQPIGALVGLLLVPHIIVTGPESSGKSTLSRHLASHFDAAWIPEYPRGYLLACGRRATLSDFDHFAKVNTQLVTAAFLQQKKINVELPFVVQDTGAEVLKLWCADKFQANLRSIEEALDAQHADLYLLCRPDLAWEYDPLREDPHRRELLFRSFRQNLDARGCRIVEISGEVEERTRMALVAAQKVLG